MPRPKSEQRRLLEMANEAKRKELAEIRERRRKERAGKIRAKLDCGEWDPLKAW